MGFLCALFRVFENPSLTTRVPSLYSRDSLSVRYDWSKGQNCSKWSCQLIPLRGLSHRTKVISETFGEWDRLDSMFSTRSTTTLVLLNVNRPVSRGFFRWRIEYLQDERKRGKRRRRLSVRRGLRGQPVC